jgi:hypothetical protein
VDKSGTSQSRAHRDNFRKVLVDGRKTACFLKAFYPGARRLAETQLEAYKKITEADLGQHVRICRLHGVMHDEEGPLMAMLLTYVDQPRTMPSALLVRHARTITAALGKPGW